MSKTKNEQKRESDRVPFICQVCFIANEHDDDVTSSLCSHVVNPFWRLLEWINICGEERETEQS